MRHLAFAAIGLLATVFGAALGTAGAARANGVPQLVKLTYLQGVSNFGPRDAEGVLEFSFAEAYLRVDVKNLKPADGYRYEGWLLSTDGSAFLTGEISIDASGIGALETKLQGLSRYDYNLFVVAGRAAGDGSNTMPTMKSIAGRFTVISDSPNGPRGDSRPGILPDTGEGAPGLGAKPVAKAISGLAIVAGLGMVGWGLIRQRRRRA